MAWVDLYGALWDLRHPGDVTGRLRVPRHGVSISRGLAPNLAFSIYGPS